MKAGQLVELTPEGRLVYPELRRNVFRVVAITDAAYVQLVYASPDRDYGPTIHAELLARVEA